MCTSALGAACPEAIVAPVNASSTTRATASPQMADEGTHGKAPTGCPAPAHTHSAAGAANSTTHARGARRSVADPTPRAPRLSPTLGAEPGPEPEPEPRAECCAGLLPACIELFGHADGQPERAADAGECARAALARSGEGVRETLLCPGVLQYATLRELCLRGAAAPRPPPRGHELLAQPAAGTAHRQCQCS